MELEEYMEAIYCEQVWAIDYPEFWEQFIDVDLDGRKEMLSVEAGEEYAPKQAHAYAFMDAELSHRGYLTVGKLDVCRDPKTDESFMVNIMDRDGERVVERLVYDPVEMLISTKKLSHKVAQRLESYGYSAVKITKTDWQTIKMYGDCRALFLPAYQQTTCTNGTPPLMETPEEGEESAFPTKTVVGVAAVIAVALTPAMIATVKRRKAAH